MRTRFPTGLTAVALLTILMLLLAACGSGTPTPTPFPTATATPRSTPLPALPTAVPVASEMMPLTMLYLDRVGSGSDEADALADAIQGETGLVINVQPIGNYGEAVAQLCGAEPVVAWLDGLSYAVADSQQCVEPVLQLERDGVAGFSVDFLLRADLPEEEEVTPAIEMLAGGTVCRVADDDSTMWLLANMFMYRAGFNPSAELDEIVEVESYDAVIDFIYRGQCDGGLVPAGYLTDGIGEELQAVDDLREAVVIAQTSPDVPLLLMVYPPTVPLSVRIPLTDALVEMGDGARQGSALRELLGADGLERVDRREFGRFLAFVNASGLDFATLGE